MVTRIAILFCCITGFGAQSLRAGGPSVYRGTWYSQSTGHQGPMRVKITPRADGNYDARFSGRFLLVVPFTYKVQLNNQGCTECGQSLGAHRQLGRLLGSYEMSAVVNVSTLNGSFSAAGDTGQISMQRVR